MPTDLNPAAAARADADFARAMSVPQALLAPRDELPPKQWASRDLELTRSVVMLTGAAWQALVETYVGATLNAIRDQHPDPSNDDDYLQLLAASRPLLELAVREMGRVRTPDGGGVCRLLRLLGDDPRARWSFAGVGGRRRADDVVGRLDDWVRVRATRSRTALATSPTLGFSRGARLRRMLLEERC